MSAPANDLYANATLLIEQDGTTSGTMLDATREDRVGAECVWYKWTPSVQCQETITVTPTDGGTVRLIKVFKGDTLEVAAEQPVTYEYRTDKTYSPQAATFTGTPGITYHIAVAFYGPEFGALDTPGDLFTLVWSQVLIDPNDFGKVMPVVTTGYPRNGLVYVPDTHEVWVIQDTYGWDSANGPRPVIACVNASNGVQTRIINYPKEVRDGLIYDPRTKTVWASLWNRDRPYGPDGHRMPDNGWVAFNAITGAFVRELLTIDVDLSGFTVSPYDDVIWSSPVNAVNATDAGTVNKFNSLTGDLIAQYPTGRSEAMVIVEHPDRTLWLLTPDEDGNVADRLVHMSATGSILGVYDFNTPDRKLMGMVFAEDTNTLWLFREDGANDTDAPAELLEYNLDTLTVDHVYETPPIWLYGDSRRIAYDPVRKQVWFHSEAEQGVLGISTVDGTLTPTLVNPYFSGAMSMTLSPDHIWAIGWGEFFRYPLFVVEYNIDVINDRDVWLQSFAERFSTVTVQPGTTTGVAQTGATGIVVASAKRLDLSASSQTFTVIQ